MTRVDLMVTLNEDAMERQSTGEADYDIARVVCSVPTAQVVSGQGTVSLHVNLNTRYANQLRKAVSDSCVVDNYVELSPYNGLRWR